MPEDIAKSEAGPAPALAFARSILEMPDGSLLVTVHGRYEREKGKTGGRGFRSMLARSTDNGQTWNYYATVADVTPGEGPNETGITRTSDGDLLAVMRNNITGGSYGGNPLWSARSKDNGQTWSKPIKLPPYAASVFPDAVLMSNGILAVSFGRPGCHLMFSVDGKGVRWTSRTTIPSNSADDYTSIRETEPGRLLFVYQENFPQESAIRGVFVDVKRK